MLQVHGEKGEGAEEGESPLTNSMNDFIMFFKHTDCTVRTMDHMWKIICWSLPALFDCRYLTHDVLGGARTRMERLMLCWQPHHSVSTPILLCVVEYVRMQNHNDT
jgi:hypothetical protein